MWCQNWMARAAVHQVQQLGADQPGEPEPQHAARLRGRPAENVDLVRLGKVLRPVREDDRQEELEAAFVTGGVEALDQAR